MTGTCTPIVESQREANNEVKSPPYIMSFSLEEILEGSLRGAKPLFSILLPLSFEGEGD